MILRVLNQQPNKRTLFRKSERERERERERYIYILSIQDLGYIFAWYILTLPVPGENPMFDRFFGWCGAVALCSRVVSRSAVVMGL